MRCDLSTWIPVKLLAEYKILVTRSTVLTARSLQGDHPESPLQHPRNFMWSTISCQPPNITLLYDRAAANDKVDMITDAM